MKSTDIIEQDMREIQEPETPKKALGPSMAQRDAIQELIAYGNRHGHSDYTMAKAIAWRIFNWTEEEEKRDADKSL